jgi:hypothetical protein
MFVLRGGGVLTALDIIETPHVHQLALRPYELRALELFKSADETRLALSTVWAYYTDAGCAHVATDGHVIAVRRAGSHILTARSDIAQLKAVPLTADGRESIRPPAWDAVLKPPVFRGTFPERRGINPAYFALVAKVEDAAGKRRAEDYVPRAGLSKRWAMQERAEQRRTTFSVWTIGSELDDGWCSQRSFASRSFSRTSTLAFAAARASTAAFSTSALSMSMTHDASRLRDPSRRRLIVWGWSPVVVRATATRATKLDVR